MSFSNVFEKMEIVLGVNGLITALDDILADEEMLSDEEMKRLSDKALEILATARMREATRRCSNCDNDINCMNCEFFMGG
jgi:hypothetical protein